MCFFFTSKLKRLLHQECHQLQNCLSKLMQGQALNTIRPHNTFYSTLQPIVMYIEILVPHLANKKRSLQVFLFFISLHV